MMAFQEERKNKRRMKNQVLGRMDVRKNRIGKNIKIWKEIAGMQQESMNKCKCVDKESNDLRMNGKWTI